MLFLLFQLGQDRYALEARRVVEVLPLLALRPLPQAPESVAGIFYYRGQQVPAVDLCQLTLGRPAESRLSTRIIIVNYLDARGVGHWVGLVAERVTEVLRKKPTDFVGPGVSIKAAPYLGPVLLDHEGAVQWIYEQRLLPDPVSDILFSQSALWAQS
ncbi:CheW protein [Verrucomicrobia bacterium]|nr:CheW protein [Verrucomicrobiota bacterium]